MSKRVKFWKVSDWRLGLKPRWFTGQQWADGTAQKALREEFFQAVEKVKTYPRREFFVNWFAKSLERD